jgi:putative restriction endonuclease
MTRYRLTTVSYGCIVDAAHIHQYAASQNDDPRNGLALCKNAHWLFDNGLWTLSDDYKVIVAEGKFDEECLERGIKGLLEYRGCGIYLPIDHTKWPDLQYIKWHRRHKFKGAV